jgi:serine/threonine-protein kinase HipA
VDGTPSTHILKPEIVRFPNTVENEAFCMRLAKHLGLSAASVETTLVNGRKLIIVQRYDRIIHQDSSVQRLHQEDFCQATGVLPEKKYEEDGGPSLTRIAGILQAVAPAADIEALLTAVVLNVLIGNGDAHAKNFSLLHHPSGALGLAPLYDLMSTLYYGDERLAIYIDSVQRMRWVTAGHGWAALFRVAGHSLGLWPTISLRFVTSGSFSSSLSTLTACPSSRPTTTPIPIPCSG